MEEEPTTTITSAIEDYLQFIRLTRSDNTALTYGKALKEFKKVLLKVNINPEKSSTITITEDLISKFILHLNAMTPTTEQLYVGAVVRFLKYLVSIELSKINLPRIQLLLKQRTRKAPVQLPRFSTTNVERVLSFVDDIVLPLSASKNERLRGLRDRAFLLTLADTGLRVHEACNLRMRDIDWNKELEKRSSPLHRPPAGTLSQNE